MSCERAILDHIQSQVVSTLETDKAGADDKIHSAITAWVGVTHAGDAVEAMIAAQLVASQELTMAIMARAIKRTASSSHYGTCIADACRMATLSLRQIETLARYRTWKRQA